MANSIGLASVYLKGLDKVYAYASFSSVLDGFYKVKEDSSMAGTFYIPNITLPGLADNSRNSTFVEGDTTFAWESYTCDYDRSRKLTIDVMDNQEAYDEVIPNVVGEMARVRTIPEVDAIRFSVYAAAAIADSNAATAVLSASDVVDAIDVADAALTNDSVPQEGRILFVSPDVYGYMKNSSDLTRNAIVNMGTDVYSRTIKMFDEMRLIVVPQDRFYTGIDLLDGSTEGETDGGYEESSAGKDINFMIVHPSAVMQFAKHQKNKLFTPEQDQDGDAFQYLYRIYHGAWELTQKEGIYCHYLTS